MFGNDFWRSLGHKRLQVIVGSAVAYSDSPTYDHFLANAVEGEIGFYNAATLALISGAIGNTTRFFVALRRGAKTFKFTPSLGSEIVKSKAPYAAPVKNVIDVYVGSRGTLTVQNIIFTSRQGGTDGNTPTVTFVDSASNNVALTIGVSGSDITVNLATDGSSAPTSTGAQVLAALQASATAMALVSVKGTGTMSTVQVAAAQTALAGGAVGTVPVAGQEYSVTIQDLTPAAQPIPTYMYTYKAVTADTLTIVMTKLAAKINDTTSPENRDRDLIVDATSSGDLLTLTAKKYGTTFRVLVRDQLALVGAAAVVFAPKMGSGYYDQVAALEETGNIFAGWTTNYPETHTIPADYGSPTLLALSTNTYNTYMYTKVPTEASRTPHNVWTPGIQYFVIAVPSNGTNPSSSLDTILGV